MYIMQVVNVLLENCVNVCRRGEEVAITIITNTAGTSFITRYAPCPEKKSLWFTMHNCNKFEYIYTVFGTNHPIVHFTKNIQNLP